MNLPEGLHEWFLANREKAFTKGILLWYCTADVRKAWTLPICCGHSKAAEIYAEGAKIVGEVNSDVSVKIGQSSVIIGNISATSAVIAGAVKGDIDVHGPVILDTTAIVMGNIKSKSVQINNGAVIEGLCSQCYADISPSTFFDEFKKQK